MKDDIQGRIGEGSERVTLICVAHDSSITGAPISLLRLLRCFSKHYNLIIIERRSGPLSSDLQQFGPVHNVFRRDSSFISLFHRIIYHSRFLSRYWVRFRLSRLLRSFESSDSLIIFSNTSANGLILEALRHLDAPVVTRVAELESVIHGFIGVKSFALVKKYSDHFVAVSEGTRRNLIERHHISPERVFVIPGAVDSGEIDRSLEGRSPDALRRELGISSESLVFGTIGHPGLRKGSDTFVKLAQWMTRASREKNIYLLWLGGTRGNPRFDELLNISSERVIVLENRANPFEILRLFSVFMSLAREDPFPLVCLESAYLGIPLLCRSGSGGAIDLVEQGCGELFDSEEPDKMLSQLIRLGRDPNKRQNYSDCGRKVVRSKYLIEHAARAYRRHFEQILLA